MFNSSTKRPLQNFQFLIYFNPNSLESAFSRVRPVSPGGGWNRSCMPCAARTG